MERVMECVMESVMECDAERVIESVVGVWCEPGQKSLVTL